MTPLWADEISGDYIGLEVDLSSERADPSGTSLARTRKKKSMV
jgi:hypothetical protein